MLLTVFDFCSNFQLVDCSMLYGRNKSSQESTSASGTNMTINSDSIPVLLTMISNESEKDGPYRLQSDQYSMNSKKMYLSQNAKGEVTQVIKKFLTLLL